jgi:hypothetical protein
MRVCFLNRLRGNYPGGDMIAMDATIAALCRFRPSPLSPGNIDAFCLEDYRDTLPDADIYHVFHCNFGWSKEIIERARARTRCVVVTPIFYPDPNVGLSFAEIRHLLNQVYVTLPFSWTEAGEIHRLVKVSTEPPIPNGTDPVFHQPNDPPHREGVLTVCARYPDKNVGTVQAVCTELGIACAVVHTYKHRDMPDIYARHRVFVNCSNSERMSLTTGEALCAGCRVIDTTENRGNEWYRPIVQCCPWSREGLKGLVRWAYSSPTWDWSPNDAARKLTWDEVARRLVEVYRSVL